MTKWKWIPIVGAVVMVAGCAGYQGPSRGVVGEFDWKGFSGVSTTALSNETPMGYREGADGSREEMYGTYTDGQRRATGIPAHIMAEAYRFEKWALLCAVAPKAPVCNVE